MHQSEMGTTIYSSLMATVSGTGQAMYPHHPLQCPEPSTWAWNGDDEFACKHKSVPTTDEKLQAAINYSISSLLIDMARDL